MTLPFMAGALHYPNFLEIVWHPWFMSAFDAAGSAQALTFATTSWLHDAFGVRFEGNGKIAAGLRAGH